MFYCIKKIARAFLLPLVYYCGNTTTRRHIQYARARKKTLLTNTVFYESFHGDGMTDNPFALFQAFEERADFSEFTHVWALNDTTELKGTINYYSEKYGNVRYITSADRRYVKFLARAHYLINSHTFPSFFIKRSDQIYLNTWHGIPLKSMGYDTPGVLSCTNIVRNFLAADYLVAANEHMFTMYADSYKLRNLFDGIVLKEGYPRVDFVHSSKRNLVLEKLGTFGLVPEPGKTIILYTPTCKTTDFKSPGSELDVFVSFRNALNRALGGTSYQVLVKPHATVYDYIRTVPEIPSWIIPSTINTNELFSITDILVTDYSSIWFDFLATNKPVVFYTPDETTYVAFQGLAFNVTELPGPAAKTMEELAYSCTNPDMIRNKYAVSYERWKQWALLHDDGSASERILDILLTGSTEGHNTVSIRSDKKRICIDSGTLKRNGITFSLINLLKILDYTKYDVTVCTPPIRTDLHRELIALFPRDVRVLSRSGSRRTGTIGELVRYFLVDAFGVKNRFLRKLFPAAYLDLELRRTTACGNYDTHIQFTGFDRQGVLEIATAVQGKKLIWQHSDMIREQYRSISGKTRYYRTLNTVFSFYPFYDRIVACSREVMEINRKQLPAGKSHAYCRNAINYEKVLAGMTEDLLETENDRRYIRYPAVTRDGVQSPDILIPLPEADMLSFVTIGRLSMEKNHDNLIRAFSSFSERHPGALLYIIGDGVMYRTLETLIHELRLDDRVILVGAVSNPFRLSCECGCFVLPSLYEGQPVVLLEARVQNLPIIVSNFETVASALMENGQYLIGTEVDDIVDGMNAFAEGRVPCAPFDYCQYNQAVSREFDALMES